MKIKNFNPGPLKTSNELYFFDSLIVEYFEGVEFKIFGSIDIIFQGKEIENLNISFNIIKEEGRKVNLNSTIENEIKSELTNLLETLKVEI